MPGVWQISRDAPSPACDPGTVSDRTAYLAAEGYVDELAHELGAVERRHGRLLLASGSSRPAAWAANLWLDPCEIKIASISDAAAKLSRSPAQLGALRARALPASDIDP